MYGNNLEGKLPTEFASWSKLYIFELGKNHFAGKIPPSIGNLSSLRLLHLGGNNLLGGIPLEISHLKKLKILLLAVNNLGGMVPPQLYNISSLSHFILYENELEGALPTNLGFTLPKLQEFYIGENRFSGAFPPSITNVSSVVIFSIYDNNITRPVPMNLGSLPNVKWLDLGGNPFGDNQLPDDFKFCNSLVNCTNLYGLNLNENGLRGELPNSIVNLSTTIQIRHLFTNNIYGSIPHKIGKLVNLRQLGLSRNSLTGTFPKSFGELSELGILDLGHNNISRVIPTSFSNINQLVILSLESNMIQGSIPTGLFDISTLQQLYLTNNRLGGVIPEEIVGLSSQFVALSLAQNLFTRPLPSFIGSFKQLVQLDVLNNKFTGYIPPSLGECFMLDHLYMKGNLFAGRFPFSYKSLKSLVILDLSNNSISGNIPSSFDEFPLIQFINLSYKQLGGEVPKEVLFSNISRFSVVGNMQLCGGIQALMLPACPVKISRNKKTFPIRTIPFLVLLPLSVLSACLACIFYRHRKSKQMKVPVPVLQDGQYPRLSYQELLLATNEFSPNNFLGEGRYGSVYKGIVESLEQTIAVKVLNVKVRGANKSFLVECEMLRNIRHRNLIKIITACSSTDFKGNGFGVHDEWEASTGDVYSYGILLLELFSGKRPTSNSILLETGHNLHDFVKKALPHRVMHIADPQMVLDQEDHGLSANILYNRDTKEECLASIFEVGILCSVATPRERVGIRFAIKQLHVARDKLLQLRQ